MNNPFTSKLFTKTWLQHFKSLSAEVKFEFIENVSFFKHKVFPYYINVGKNLTKGINYSINYNATDFKGKVCLIYDVPEYFKLNDLDTSKTSIRCKKVFQYKGFALDFNEFETSDDYIASRISSKNRRGYRSRLRRLEECFDIRYSFMFGEVQRSEYDVLFKQFHELLSKRFSEKEVNYHHLQTDKWNFYKELVYYMLQEKKASLFTIYNGSKPIGITLNFHSEDIAFVTITVFNPDYYKFNVGKASIVKLLELCYDQNIKIMDFSKGEFDFKYEWCNLVYDFDYHIIYDSKSIKAVLTANLITAFFKFKNYLRKNNINKWYRKLLHKLKSKDKQSIDFNKLQIEYVNNFEADQNHDMLDMNNGNNEHFKKFIYSFLFINPEPEDDLNVFKSKKENCYFIKGKDKTQKITIGF